MTFGDKIAYAQFLHDGSELLLKHGMVGKHYGDERIAWTVEVPQKRPDVIVPVIEFMLKDCQ